MNDKRKLKLRLSSQLRLINLALRAWTLNRSQYLLTTFWQFGNHPESCIKRPATPVGMFKPLKIQKLGINFHFSLPKDENKFLTLIPLYYVAIEDPYKLLMCAMKCAQNTGPSAEHYNSVSLNTSLMLILVLNLAHTFFSN